MKELLKYILIITLACYYSLSYGQKSLYDIYQNPDMDDFSLIQQQAEDYFLDKDKDQGPGYKQWKRWEYMNQHRLTPDGKITNYSKRNWNAYHEYFEANPQYKNPNPTDVTNGSWNFIAASDYVQGSGTSPGIGRVNCIAFHPTNPNIFYIGMPSGGLWKTTNGGSNWTCLTDGMPSLGVSGIVVHPTSPNTIYILTGDGDGSDTYSIGVMKTINGGENWNFTGLEWGVQDFVGAFKLIMHPNSSSILFAVTTAGVYKTVDDGLSWNLVIEDPCEDLEFKPGDPTMMYAVGYYFYRSTNTGENWDIITAGVPSFLRIAMGVTPANSNYVYLLAGPATDTGEFRGFYRSTNSGLSFSLQSITPNILGSSLTGNNDSDQCWYDIAIAISRMDANHVMTGGINNWVSNDFGVTWTISSYCYDPNNSIGFVHADIHALEINPLNNYLYCGSDGGISRSTDFGDTWTDLSSGINNSQFYRIAGTESDFNLIIGGTQDNGSNKWTGGSSMEQMYGKDGMDCLVDHSNSDILYYCAQKGDLRKSIDGGVTQFGIRPDSLKGAWVTPLVMDPTNNNIIYAGYYDVCKSTDGGDTWINTGVDGDNALAIGTSNPNWIYASYSNDLFRSANAAESWTTLPTPDNHPLTFIAVDPVNPLRVFVTVGNYNEGDKVYRSTTGGSTWTNISGSLPNVPVNCIAYENGPLDALYIGTDIGVFYRNNDIGDWIPFMNGLPTVRIMDLEINNTYNLLGQVLTEEDYGHLHLFTECPSWYTLTPLNDPSNPNYTGFQFYEASSFITSSRIITGGPGTNVTYKAGSSISLITGFHVRTGNKFKAQLGSCDAGALKIGIFEEQQSEKESEIEK